MVLVLSADQQPLDPVHPARARALLKRGRAIVVRRFPCRVVQRADGYRYALQDVRGLFAALTQADDSLNRIPPPAESAGFLRGCV